VYADRDDRQSGLFVLFVARPRPSNRGIERVWIHIGRTGADGFGRALDTRRERGLGFSIMVSVRNLALFGTDWFGSNLLDQYHLSFNSLVIANSATTLIAVPLVLLLPRLIVIRKDAENRATTKRP
jgi:hypothetical protein